MYNVAYPGDTLLNISNIRKNNDLRKLICEKNFESKWDVILLSAGGNDLIDRMDQIVCKPTVSGSDNWLDYIDRVELANLKSLIFKGYKYISDIRIDSINKNTPILTHVYDYPTPRYAKARLFGIGAAGPWLYPAFKMHDVPEKFWMSITDYVYESFAASIIDLEDKLPNFYVSSLTRGALTRADLGEEGTSGDWKNEIHPTTKGYKKIANIISHDIYKILS